MSDIKKWFAYAVFIMAVLIFLVYYLFPSEFVERYIIFKAGQFNPNLKVSIGRVFPTFPPGLRFDTISLEYLDALVLDAEEIRVVPRLASFFGPKWTIRFNLKAHGGILNGRAEIIAKNDDRQFDIKAKIFGMQLADIPAVRNLTAFKLSGVLRADIIYKNAQEIDNPIRASVEILNCELQPLKPLSIKDRLTFKQIEAVLNIRNYRIDIEHCNFKGNQVDGTVSGFGVLKDPFNKSIIELSGILNPHHLFFKHLSGDLQASIFNDIKSKIGDVSISIKGPIENPAFNFH
ncbi:MAG: type II secretion system protein GspN [Deltaproteobacteria bacterium]|nr:MAG: type II secretion system protein GspN [Deltaproteobacteria bacterium]